jgi:uncharacterized protein
MSASTLLRSTSGVLVGSIMASSPGSWGNELEVRVTHRHDDQVRVLDVRDGGITLAVERVHTLSSGAVVVVADDAGNSSCRVVARIDPVERLVELGEPVALAGIASRLDLTTFGIDVRAAGRVLESRNGLSLSAQASGSISIAFDADVSRAVAHRRALPTVTVIDGRGDPSNWELPAAGTWVRLTGGTDGLASLSAEDFIGERLDGSEDEFERRRKSRGVAALDTVDEVGLVAVPDLWPKLIPLTKFAPKRGCDPDPCDPFALETAVWSLLSADTHRSLSRQESLRVQAAVIEHCEQHGDRVAVLDPPPSTSDGLLGDEELAEWRSAFSTGFAATYTPWLDVAIPRLATSAPTVRIPPSGHLCGLIATNDARFGVHHAPANVLVDWVQDSAVRYDDDAHGRWNELGVNVLRESANGRLRVLGARTLSHDSTWTFLNVRRLVIFIERWLRRNLQWAAFEPNSGATRSKILLTVTGFLAMLSANGAFAGTGDDARFVVRCDEENNPPSQSSLGRLHVDIAIAPSLPWEFIILRLARIENSFAFTSETTMGGGPWRS